MQWKANADYLKPEHFFMNTTAFAAQPNRLALSADYASVPMRSSATSTMLTEAGRRHSAAREARDVPGAVIGFIRSFLGLADFSKMELGAKVSLAFTPGGPLVYQWPTIKPFHHLAKA